MDRKEIHYLRFIFEAYDGIATLTTVDPDLGIVCLRIPPGCENDVKIVLQDIKKDVMIAQVRQAAPKGLNFSRPVGLYWRS